MQKQLSLFGESEIDQNKSENFHSIETNSLNEYLQRFFAEKDQSDFERFLNFIGGIKNYSIYNNLLVYIQNPNVKYYATANEWQKKFNRKVKNDANPLIILAPMTPVLIVYDISDTKNIENFEVDPFNLEAEISTENSFELLFYNLSTLKIDTSFSGSINHDSNSEEIIIERSKNKVKKIMLLVKSNISIENAHIKILKNLAALHFGHLGEIDNLKIIDRKDIPSNLKRIEIFAVMHLLKLRLSLETGFFYDINNFNITQEELRSLNYDLIVKTAAYLEKLCKKKINPK